MKINLQISDPWKIQLTTAINFIFLNNAEKEPVMHSKKDNIKLTPYNEANKAVDELFHSLSLRYQDNLGTSMRGSNFFLIQFKWCITNVMK